MKKVFCSICIVCCLAFSNDFTGFEQDESAGFGNVPSISDLQTRDALTNTGGSNRIKTQDVTQIELMRKANIQRNGNYLMLTQTWLPIQRIATNGNYINGYSPGIGVKGGVVSYIDSYIAIRGYLSFDVANDALSPINEQRSNFAGTFLMVGLGVDILVDFFIDRKYKNTMGFFIGVGAGAFTYFDINHPVIIPSQDSQKFIFGANLTVEGGFSTVFAYRHRVEIGVRFLPTQSLSVDDNGMQIDYNSLYIGYSYKFKKK